MSRTSSRQKAKRIMLFGTFDGLHKGHFHFFKQARRLAPKSFLVASVARDKNVFRIKKKFPKRTERARLALLRGSGYFDKVVLSGAKNHLPHILKERPDIIALGYDQRAYVRNLKKDLKSKGLAVEVVRLKPYKKRIYKNSLLDVSQSQRNKNSGK